MPDPKPEYVTCQRCCEEVEISPAWLEAKLAGERVKYKHEIRRLLAEKDPDIPANRACKLHCTHPASCLPRTKCPNDCCVDYAPHYRCEICGTVMTLEWEVKT